MTTFLQAIISGVAIGLVYGLPALAIVLLNNTANFFNLAQGEMLMVSTFVLYQLYSLWQLPLWLCIVITLAVMVLIGLLINWAIFNPLRKYQARELFVLAATIALGIFFKNLSRIIWGSTPVSLTMIWPTEPLYIFGLRIMPSSLIILAVSVVLIVGLFVLQDRTKFGIAMRAASENKMAASLMGIRVNSVIGAAFAISLLVTAVAGILSTNVLYIYPEMADSLGLKAFAATIIGGFGNSVGAVIGGIIIGIVETLVSFVLPSSLKDGVTFVLLIAFLLFRPTGLFKVGSSSKV